MFPPGPQLVMLKGIPMVFVSSERMSPEQRIHRHRRLFARLMRDCDGQDMVEYCLLIALVALVSVVALGSFTNVITAAWTTFTNNLSGS
jgi:Flp pilus assembly pilin Flp